MRSELFLVLPILRTRKLSRLGLIASVIATSHVLYPARTSQAQEPKLIAVEAVNKSLTTPCAETDNVHIDFKAANVRSLRIEATHPAYIGTVVTERPGADFTACDMRSDPQFNAKPRKKTFWETSSFWLTGFTFPSFWRPNDVPIRVGNNVERGFHLIQLWMRYRERAEEILVLYPPDGYWRARPLPFADLRWTAYGSSFLVGPVEMKGRPLVRFKEIVFDPKNRSFTLHFVRGGSARLIVKSIDQQKIAIDVSFSKPLPESLPFAALRSMYVTETNADVAQLAWRNLNDKGWSEAPVMAFKKATAATFWAGRRVPSLHNLSAPDFVFSRFSKFSKARN